MNSSSSFCIAFAHSVHVIFIPYLEPTLTAFSLNNKDPYSKTVEYLGEDLNLKSPPFFAKGGNPSIKLRAGLNDYPVVNYGE